MKFIKIIFLCLIFSGSFLALSSCGNKSKSSNTEMQGKEYTSAYVCPMHCKGSGSDEAGKCPVCGMDYVINEDHKSDGHTHENHDDHNH